MYREENRFSAKTPIEAIIDVVVARDMLKDKQWKQELPASD